MEQKKYEALYRHLKERLADAGQGLKKSEVASVLNDIENNIEVYKRYFPDVVKDKPDPFGQGNA